MIPKQTSPWTNSIFRWAGSKRKLLPLLISQAPSRFERYIEPFGGSACLLFALHPQKAVLADINADLMGTYGILGRHPHRLRKAVSEIPQTAKKYFEIRSASIGGLDEFEKAVRFVYLNRFCFNGVYRTNRRGVFNVPRGRNTGQLPPSRAFYRGSVALRGTQLRAVDFHECLHDVKRGDFVYLDPPYATSKRRAHGEYGYDSFGVEDLDRLLETLNWLDREGAHFLLSYTAAPPVVRAAQRWHCTYLYVRRNVAGFGRARKMAREILVSNYSRLPLQH